MSWITLLPAFFQIMGKVLDLLTKTPEERLGDVQKALLQYAAELVLRTLSTGDAHEKD